MSYFSSSLYQNIFPPFPLWEKLVRFCTLSLPMRTLSSSSDLFPTPFVAFSFLFPFHLLHLPIPPEKQQGGHSTKICFHRAEPWNWTCICKWNFPNKFSKPCPNRHQTQFNTLLPNKFKAILLKWGLKQVVKVIKNHVRRKNSPFFFFIFQLHFKSLRDCSFSCSWHSFPSWKMYNTYLYPQHHKYGTFIVLFKPVSPKTLQKSTFFSFHTSIFVCISNLFRRFTRYLC